MHPLLIVKDNIISLQPESPQNNTPNNHLEVANYVKLVQDFILEDAMFPRKRAPKSPSGPTGDKGVVWF
jgi:hypothetical protein